METNDSILMALIDAAIFFEFSDSSVIDPDVAVGALEQMAYRLKQLPKNDLIELNSQFLRLSGAYPEMHRLFVRDFAKNMGVCGDHPGTQTM